MGTSAHSLQNPLHGLFDLGHVEGKGTNIKLVLDAPES